MEELRHSPPIQVYMIINILNNVPNYIPVQASKDSATHIPHNDGLRDI